MDVTPVVSAVLTSPKVYALVTMAFYFLGDAILKALIDRKQGWFSWGYFPKFFDKYSSTWVAFILLAASGPVLASLKQPTAVAMDALFWVMVSAATLKEAADYVDDIRGLLAKPVTPIFSPGVDASTAPTGV